MKIEYLAMPALLAVLGVAIGVVPVWLGIFIFIPTGLAFAVEAARLFNGGFDGDIVAVANATTGITLSPPSVHESSESWNCRNCGGPNINQIRCEYCGRVKE